MTTLLSADMYDAIYPLNIPQNALYVGGYTDGNWPWMVRSPNLFPNAKKFTFCVFPSGDAMCLDVEHGDATPAQAPGWVVKQRNRGKDPVVYCSRLSDYGWQAVQDAFNAARVPHPHYGIADYNGSRALPVLNGITAIFHQYADVGPYDLSSLSDTFMSIVGGTPVMELTDKLPNGASVQDALMDRMLGQSGKWTMVPGSTAAWELTQFNAIEGALTKEEADLLVAVKGVTAGAVDVNALAAALVPLLPAGSTPEEFVAALTAQLNIPKA